MCLCSVPEAAQVWAQVPVVNATQSVSDVGHQLCELYPQAPFSASYRDVGEARQWSLRSVGAYDVSAIAKQYGGGGRGGGGQSNYYSGHS